MRGVMRAGADDHLRHPICSDTNTIVNCQLGSKMRVTVLTHLERQHSQELDPVIGQVARALRRLGHNVSILAVHADLTKLISGLKRRKPDLIFNLMETFGHDEFGAAGLAGVLDLVGIPYTGGGPGETYIQEDKGLAKKLLAYEKLLYPDFAVFAPDADLETGGKLRFPLFVKPLRMEASIGVDGESLVRTVPELMDRIKQIHAEVHDAALVEEYIEGREIYVGVLGNHDPRAFPPVEIDFAQLPNGQPHIVGAKAKWDEKSTQYRGTRPMPARLSDEVRARVNKAALLAYRALRVRDYGRIDLRLTQAGEVYVIEVNASCYLEKSTEFVMAAAEAGLDYENLVNGIVDHAMERRKQAVCL